MIDLNFKPKTGTIIAFVIFLLLVAIFGPLCVVWALNYLFGLTIAYDFQSWVAVVVLHAFINTTIGRK